MTRYKPQAKQGRELSISTQGTEAGRDAAALGGFGAGPGVARRSWPAIVVPETDTARVQECHITLG